MQELAPKVALDLADNTAMAVRTEALALPPVPFDPSGATVSGLEDQLAHIASERAALVSMLEGIPEREREMLEHDAPDSAFQKIDLDRRRAHLKLQRLNERATELEAALQTAQDADTERHWLGYVDRYETAAKALAAVGELLMRLDAELFSLVNESQRAGFSRYALHQAQLPWQPLVHNQDQLFAYLKVIPGLRQVRFDFRPPKLFVVRFLAWTPYGGTAYMRDQEAGFAPDEAWALVLAQKAEWANPSQIPPRPAPRRKAHGGKSA